MRWFSLIAGVCAFLLLTAFGPDAPARAAETLAGPVPAEVVRVVDGDTLDVRARIWLGQDVFVRVRLAGIDTPELRGKCPDEKEKARAAKAWLSRVEGKAVALSGIHYGKYAGRVLANVSEAELGDLAERLITAGFARPYEGGARAGWCGVS
ncbi:thermonuclease family protein [Tepidicaulis marinus]|uniref:thermonuclease family protein n=1 Tax=Tepidicaulis marinus TaxID=1333998 RepID=UPI00069495BA|nr:thermonuclease family protein [Tepidicaulis marinus]